MLPRDARVMDTGGRGLGLTWTLPAIRGRTLPTLEIYQIQNFVLIKQFDLY